MTSVTISPSIDQAALQLFQASFHSLAQQSTSHLMSCGAVQFLPSKGKTNNFARIGRLELTEVSTRNPDKQYGDYALDNRQLTKRRFTTTITIDQKYDVNELLADPKSDILAQLNAAKERQIDRIIAAAAIGPVLTGAPDAAPTPVTAVNDGVLTVDAISGGVTYDSVQRITENFINNDVPMSEFRGAIMALTGKEHTDLMGEDEFTSNDYINGSPVDSGAMNNAGLYRIATFAGSRNGGVQVTNAILPEATTTRSCLVLAPKSIAMSMEIGRLEVERSPLKVNSTDITIDLWINAMRTEGARVQILSTTM